MSFSTPYNALVFSLSILAFKPPSAEALRYLCTFAQPHDAFSQLSPAFTAALTIPGHIKHSAAIILPEP